MLIDTKILDWTAELAIRAGSVITEYAERGFSHTTKSSPNDFVTEADLASERLILSSIQKQYPEDSILSEESLPNFQTSENGHTWIIDPLDGTWNFVHGIQNCGVMIAYANSHEVLFSVLYNPFKNILVKAVRNHDVFVNERLVKYTKTDNFAIIADNKGFQPVLEHMNMEGTCLWSSVDNTLLVLSGERNVYLNKTARIWDLSPISLCLEEYGLVIKSSTGDAYRWHQAMGGLIAFPSDFSEQAKTIIDYPLPT